MSYIYEVFEHLQLLGMGIWMHIHSVTNTDVSPNLGYLAESLGDARVQTIPLCYRLGVAHFSMLQALKVLIFSYSLFCVLTLIPP
jgi:hypothetical protein